MKNFDKQFKPFYQGTGVQFTQSTTGVFYTQNVAFRRVYKQKFIHFNRDSRYF